MNTERAIRFIKRTWKKEITKIVTLLILILLLSGLLFRNFESEISTLTEAFYFSIVTVSTVGYGDITPKSGSGRIVSVFLIFSGMIMISSFTAAMSSVLISKKLKEGQGVSRIKGKNFVVICGWNWKTESVIGSLGSSGIKDIVLVNELDPSQIDTLTDKFSSFTIRFVRGDFTDAGILKRADVENSRGVIIVPDCSVSSSQGADEKTVFATMTIKSISDKIKVHVQLLRNETVPYIQRAKADSYFISDNTVPFFLASDVANPGITDIMHKLMSENGDDIIESVPVPADYEGKLFSDLSQYFRSKHRSVIIGLVQFQDVLEMKNINSKDTTSIDAFIKRKFEEAGRLTKDLDKKKIVLNPEDDYVLNKFDIAIVITKKRNRW